MTIKGHKIPLGELTVVKMVSYGAAFIVFLGGLYVHYFNNQVRDNERFQELKGKLQEVKSDIRLINYRISILEGVKPENKSEPVANQKTINFYEGSNRHLAAGGWDKGESAELQ